MNIAYDHQIFCEQPYGGISRYFFEIAEGVASLSDCQVQVLAPFYVNTFARQTSRAKLLGIRIPLVPRTTRARLRLNAAIVKLLMAKNPPDVLHETYYSHSTVAPKGTRIVTTVHDMINERLPELISPRDKTSRLKFECLFRADHVICVSESTKKDLTSFYAVDPRKLSVIYHGCSFPVSVPPSDDVCAPFLLFVGLRGSYKNFTRLLEVYAGSASIKRDFKLICFGGPRFSALELHNMKILGVEGRVTRVVGDDKRLQNLYCSAACFIYPSLYEGFGMPVLEAMACGCPVACSSTSSLPEIGGGAAEYFEPSDCDSIRTAIERLVYSDTRRRYMAVQGKHRAAQFSWDRCARQTFQVYSSLMKSVAWPQYPSAISETH